MSDVADVAQVDGDGTGVVTMKALPPADALPVVNLQAARAPDEFDVILDNVIVGRHSDKETRDAIAATNKPLLEHVKSALAPI